MGTIPSNWQTGTITGTFLDDNFDPFVGKAVVTPDAKTARVFGQANTLLKAKDYPIDTTTGVFTAVRPAGNDPDVSPAGFTYTVTIVTLDGGRTDFPVFTFVLAPGATVDLDEVTVVAPTPGLPNVVGGGGGGPTTVDQITDAGTAGKASVRANTQQQGRDAIGATNLVIGTTSTTAWAGNRKTDWATEIEGKPTTFPPSTHTHAQSDIGGSTQYTQEFMASPTALAGRQKLGITTVGDSVVTAGSQQVARDALGVNALIDTRLADVARISYDANYVPIDVRPVIWFTQAQPANLRSQDRWFADAAG